MKVLKLVQRERRGEYGQNIVERNGKPWIKFMVVEIHQKIWVKSTKPSVNRHERRGNIFSEEKTVTQHSSTSKPMYTTPRGGITNSRVRGKRLIDGLDIRSQKNTCSQISEIDAGIGYVSTKSPLEGFYSLTDPEPDSV